jgi:HPt (histidine-containing phosphotransfer) domain-containing protein
MGQSLSQMTSRVVFDRDFFEHCTMRDKHLMREVIDLFKLQVESAVVELADLRDGQAWKFQAHRLKGAAAAVGATEIQMIASSWENRPMPARFSEREALRETLSQAMKAYVVEADKVVQTV